MKVSRPVVLAVAAWLTVVLVGSTVVWTIISHVGGPVALRADTVGPGPSASASATGPGAGPTGAGRSGRAPRTKDSPSTQPSRAASTGSTTGPTSGPTKGSVRPGGGGSPSRLPTRHGALPPASSPPPVPEVRRATWSGVGGVVSVSCQGAALSLTGATPDPGFSVEVDKETHHLEVQFKGQGSEERETKVEAGCVSGTPRFSVEAGGGSDD